MDTLIEDFDTKIKPHVGASIVDFAQRASFRSGGRIRLGLSTDLVKAPVQAVVNRGRWIARCECFGAEYVTPAEPIFMCLSCFNREYGNKWRPVEFPEEKLAIEQQLLARPDERTRNWEVHELVADLLIENGENRLL